MRKNSWGTIALAAAVAGMMTFSGCGAAAKSTSSNTSAPSPESSAAPAKPDFPKKEVTLIVPYPAGGGTDMVGRALAKSAEKYLGQLL